MAAPRRKDVAVVLGSQWGDEGKGKLVDILSADVDLCVRCQVRRQLIARGLGLVKQPGIPSPSPGPGGVAPVRKSRGRDVRIRLASPRPLHRPRRRHVRESERESETATTRAVSRARAVWEQARKKKKRQTPARLH
jgi:hypothetical protein